MNDVPGNQLLGLNRRLSAVPKNSSSQFDSGTQGAQGPLRLPLLKKTETDGGPGGNEDDGGVVELSEKKRNRAGAEKKQVQGPAELSQKNGRRSDAPATDQFVRTEAGQPSGRLAGREAVFGRMKRGERFVFGHGMPDASHKLKTRSIKRA